MQPGQFFTEYLDTLPKLKKLIAPADYAIVEATAAKVRERATFFVLPPGGELTDRRMKTLDGSLLRPPYECVVLEYVALPGPIGPGEVDCPKRIVIAMDMGDKVHILPCVYSAKEERWVPHIYVGAINLLDDNILYMRDNATHVKVKYDACLDEMFKTLCMAWGGNMHEYVERIAADLRDEVNAYIDFCYALHTHQIAYEDIEPDKAKNKMRRARGKAPLFTYKVLTIGKKKRKSAHLGGTHASPRSHLRRGHYRTSKSGKRYWVQPCMVKGETPGFVHKDYKVEVEAA